MARRFVIAGPWSRPCSSAQGRPLWAGVRFVLGGIGSSLSIPARLGARADGGGGAGARMSLFHSAARWRRARPLAYLVGRLALRGLTLAMIPTLLLMPLLLRVLPATGGHARPSRGLQGVAEAARSMRGALGLLFAISAIAAFVQRAFVTLQPIAIAAGGGSEAMGATVLSVYLSAQALGSIAGGLLADRFDRTRLLLWLIVASLPAHLLALALPHGAPLALAATATAGLLNMALLPPLVIMAQDASPHGAATSAGIIMGLAWAAGSVAMIGAGAVADVIGPRSAALLCVPVLLGAALAALHPAVRPYGRARPVLLQAKGAGGFPAGESSVETMELRPISASGQDGTHGSGALQLHG
jgi:FSR family fosmidomycin resistance protein-like MFS transporter